MTVCSLREYAPGDAEELYRAVRESVDDVYPWLPWCHAQYSLVDAVEWIQALARRKAEGTEYGFAIVSPEGRYLGGCGINQINRLHRFGNVGYWVRSSETGRGVASSAVRQLADFAFRTTDLVRLEIVCAVGNQRSQRVAERAGAVREGVLRDRLMLHGEAVDAVMYSVARRKPRD